MRGTDDATVAFRSPSQNYPGTAMQSGSGHFHHAIQGYRLRQWGSRATGFCACQVTAQVTGIDSLAAEDDLYMLVGAWPANRLMSGCW